MPKKHFIAYFLLFLIAIVFWHNASHHRHVEFSSEATAYHHHHHHNHHSALWNWFSQMLHNWQHVAFGERHFEDLAISLNLDKVLHLAIAIALPPSFLGSNASIETCGIATFFCDSAYLEPPPGGRSSPRAPPSFS